MDRCERASDRASHGGGGGQVGGADDEGEGRGLGIQTRIRFDYGELGTEPWGCGGDHLAESVSVCCTEGCSSAYVGARADCWSIDCCGCADAETACRGSEANEQGSLVGWIGKTAWLERASLTDHRIQLEQQEVERSQHK